HDVGVQGELAGRGDDAGVVDVQVQLVHGGHGHGEEVVLVGRVDEDLRGAFHVALGGGADQHQGIIAGRMLEDGLGVPGDVVRAVAQEVVVAQLGPQLLRGVRVDAGGGQ